jgi:hypothetical protein
MGRTPGCAAYTVILMRLFYFRALIVLLSLFCLAEQSDFAQDIESSNAGSGINNSLSALENKLFLHDYSSDTTEERLIRLEDMVFGKKESGSPQSRLNKLTVAISGPDITGVTSTNNFSAPAQRTDASNFNSPANVSPSSSSGNFNQRRPVLAEYGLGKLPPTAPPISSGSSATISSLPPAAPPLASWVTSNFSSAPYSTSAASPSVPSYLGNLTNKVDWMETTLFGQNFSDPLPIRVLRLEGKVFPQQPPATNLSLTERVSRLLNAVSMYPSR